jgi:hypothetical protein
VIIASYNDHGPAPFYPSLHGWFWHHQVYSGLGAGIVMESIVTLQNNGHDDSEASAAAHPLSPRSLARRFFHPQLPKIIIARLQEWKSGIVGSSWYADDLVADMATLNINDNTSDSVSTLRSIGSPSTRE